MYSGNITNLAGYCNTLLIKKENPMPEKKLRNESLQKMYEDSTFHLQQELWFQELLKEPNQATIENCTIAKKALAALRNEVARLEDELEKWELFSSEGYGL